MPSWIGQAFRRGILTSRFPRAPASREEVPETSRPPVLPPGLERIAVLGRAADDCPTGAITADGLYHGRCIRCARCTRQGFTFGGRALANASRPEDLYSPGGGPLPERLGPAPLAGLGRSLQLFLVDAGSCLACNREVLALANPYYDAARLGITFVNSPHHADVLVVVGIPTRPILEPLRRAYEALPGPKAVLAIGACALEGGLFRGNPGTQAPLSGTLPVDLFVPGCPPSPLDILAGILTLAGRRKHLSGAPG
jgi:Ni,Fe-hydrogenase III small subunit